MAKKQQGPAGEAQDVLWSTMLRMLFLAVFCIVVSLGYLMLEDHIHSYLNKKEYTPEELEDLSRKAMARLSAEKEEANWDKVVNGIHLRTGFYDDPNLSTVIAACTSCHSAKLVTQNRATRAGWKSMIEWMQATQGLPDLGRAEPIILDYLAEYYAPQEVGRRKNLDVQAIEWYALNLE